MLKLVNISKQFPGVKALNKVSLEILPGEIHAICGENGAGKTTLMHIIAGNQRPDEGSIFWNGQEMEFTNRKQSRETGIGIVYQERSLVDSLTIAENIFAEQLPLNKWGLTDRKKLVEKTKNLLDELELVHLHPATKLHLLSAGQQQMVEIAKALAQEPLLLLLDEPTASITETEKETLFSIIRKLKSKGVAIVYISHRMTEIRNIANRITVLKDGVFQGTVKPSEITDHEIIKMMIGRELAAADYSNFTGTEPVLQLKNVSGKNFNDISFDVFKGEVFGIAGLIGSGRTELARALFGADKIYQGDILLDHQPYIPDHPATAIKKGLVYLTEERKALGIFAGLTVHENISVSVMQLSDSGMKAGTQNSVRLFKTYQQKLGIKAISPWQKIFLLSGGNQQKALLARCLAAKPKLLIADEPTQGIDAGAKSEIYDLIRDLAKDGLGMIMISSELTELLIVCDRIAVMSEGRLEKILNKEEASEELIMQYAYAGKKRG